MTRDDDDQRSELSRALLTLRKAAGMNQVVVVERAKVAQGQISQARLSRIEQGKSIPTPEDTALLAALYGADDTERRRLAAMTVDANSGVEDDRLIVQRGRTLGMQQRWRRLENESQVVRSYHPAVVLGILQTAAYASVILDDGEVVADRQRRRASLLTRNGPRYVLIQTEGALRYRVGSAAVMVEQLDAIMEASRRPNVEFGIIPWRREAEVVPVAGFHIYDDHTVTVTLQVAAATLTKDKDLVEFGVLFARLTEVAVWGEDARLELCRIIAETI